MPDSMNPPRHTAPEHMEESLRQSEATLRAVLNASQESIWLFDPDGIILLGNETAWRRLQVKAEDGVGRNFRDFMPPALAESRLKDIRAVVATGRPVEAEDERAGMIFHHTYSPVLDRQGKTVQIASFSQDITPRRRAEEALQESVNLYRAIGEAIDFGIWVCTPDGRNTYASPSFLALVGQTQEACSNFGWGEVLHPDDAAQTLAAWQECTRTGELWDREHRFKGVDGLWHPVLARGVPVRNDRGEIIFWAGINLDIARIKEAEETLKRAVEDLERSNRELSQFAYICSHDLQEPLRQVLVFVDMFKSGHAGALEESQERYLAMIQEGALRMNGLIRGLLDYSRVGSPEPTGRRLPIHEPLTVALANLQHRIEESGAVITQEALPTLWAEPTQIAQLFQNLIGNAIKFSREGVPPRIHIACAPEGDRHRISIQDNGIGIDPRYHDKIFQIFQRLHDREQYPGTGIGLAICLKIVEQHGGKLRVESTPGQGTTFSFTL